MRRGLGRERLALGAFALLWLPCVALSTFDALRGTAYPPFYLHGASAPDAFPTPVGDTAAALGLAPGDRLLALQGASLRGVGPVGWRSLLAAHRAGDGPVTLRLVREGDARTLAVQPRSYAMFWPRLPASLAFAVMGALLLLRAPASPAGRSFAWAYLAAALFFACTFAGRPWVTGASIAVHLGSLALAAPLGLRGALLFPDAPRSESRWARFGPWAFAGVALLDASRLYEFPFSRQVGALGSAAVVPAYFALGVAVTTLRYRAADAIGRRQLKWVLLGAYLAAAPPVLAAAAAALDPRHAPLLSIAISSLVLIPLSVLVGVLRYNLFDVDRLLSGTASSSTLALVFLAGAGVGIPALAEAMGETAGVSPRVTQFGLSLALIAALVVAYRPLRSQVERALFADQHRLERGIDELLGRLSGCVTSEELTRLAGEELHALLRPLSCGIFTRSGDGYASAFVRGKALPLAFAPDSPLIATLRERRSILIGRPAEGGSRLPAEDPFDRAALQALEAALIVPIRRDDQLVAFACLGPKQSGDLYTSTDRTLLNLVADKVSAELLRFDLAELVRASAEMQRSLRRYVPGSLATQLDRGRELTAGEADVTVLFVDLRGYAGFAETLTPREIFSSVNRYTETVSARITANGGTVVEFNGDGMMAVFGAPEPLPGRERAAARAGLEIIRDVAGLLAAPGAAGPGVGVGIASGSAFVGNVRAVDRLIWTALGNTTNLAARLQDLTRELGAALIVDEATWRELGELGAGFEQRPGVRIRGRRERQTVYALLAPRDAPTSRSADLYPAAPARAGTGGGSG